MRSSEEPSRLSLAHTVDLQYYEWNKWLFVAHWVLWEMDGEMESEMQNTCERKGEGSRVWLGQGRGPSEHDAPDRSPSRSSKAKVAY